MCGLIIEHLGWEAVFYITAGITVLWVIVWQVATKICNFPNLFPLIRVDLCTHHHICGKHLTSIIINHLTCTKDPKCTNQL